MELLLQLSDALLAFEAGAEQNACHPTETSDLPEDENVRAAAQQYLEEQERLALTRRTENSQNWLWFKMTKIEIGRGEYKYNSSVSIEAIRSLAVSKAPVPENLVGERDSSVMRASQFVHRIALKALEQEGKEVIPGVKTVTPLGYTITYNEASGDLAIDKVIQTYPQYETGKIKQTYRPDGVLKAKFQEITHNRLLTRDLSNFDYIESRLLTKECLPGLSSLVEVYGQDAKVDIEIWAGGKKEEAKVEEMSGKTFISSKANMQILKSGKHLQVLDLQGSLIMKAYADKVEKPMTCEQCQHFQARYARLAAS